MEAEPALRFDTNVDDMDPRLWPGVIDSLLAAGAQDAWLTPIVMKKGRPAFTLSALVDDEHAGAVRQAIFRETTTIGLRESPVTKYVLGRDTSAVEVEGQTIQVKVAFDAAGETLNRSVEWDDVAAASERLGLSAKQVLGLAIAAAENLPTT